MTRIHCGALLERPPGPKYLSTLDFAELAVPEPLPRLATFRRWKEQLPDEGLTLSLVAPRSSCRSAKGPLRFDDEMSAAFDLTVQAAELLGAAFVVVPTDPDVTTGPRDRDLLRAWFSRWPGEQRLVWHPRGLWDAEIAEPFARDLGAICAFDPLESEAPAGGTLYARLKAMGTRKRFSETLLLEVVDALAFGDADEAYCAIESPKSFSEARRLAQLAAESTASA